MRFSFATSSDAPEVLSLLEAEAAPGNLQLLYTRRDDPVASFTEESPESVTGLIRDDSGRAVAMVTIIPRRMYIGGQVRNVCYITSMKKDPSYTRQINWHRVFSRMDATGSYDAYYCSFIIENDPVRKMFLKRRTHIPYSVALDKYETFIFSPKVRVKDPFPELELCRIAGPEAAAFLTSCGKKHDLFPSLKDSPDISALLDEGIYCLKKDGRIVAAGALWDRRKVKQYYLMECRGIMKLLRLCNPLLSMLGYITLPPDDTMVKFAFLSFMTAEDDSPELLTSLFCRLKAEAQFSYDMIVAGATHSGSEYPVLRKIRAISFTTEINEIVMNGINDKPPAGIDGKSLDLECALL